MGRSHTIVRNITTTLTRADTLVTLDALAASALALFQAGGDYDLGVDRVWVQWAGATLEIVLEDDALDTFPALSTRNSTIKTGLETLTGITTVNTADIETWEQSALAVTSDVAIGVTYAADAWDEHWEDPEALPSGWALDTTGADPDTAASYVEVGTGHAMQLDSDGDGKARVTKTFSALTTATSWELRLEFKVTARADTSGDTPIWVYDGTRRINFRPNATYWRYEGLSSVMYSTPGVAAVAVNNWVTITIRRYRVTVSSNDYDVVELWDGPRQMCAMAYGLFLADANNDGMVAIGNNTTGARTATIRRFSLKTGGVNAAPPSWTYRGTAHGR